MSLFVRPGGRYHRSVATAMVLLAAGIQGPVLWARSVRVKAGRQRGASTVEWVLLCVLVAALAAVLSVALIRMVISTTNLVRTR